MQRVLAEIWLEVLGLDTLWINQDFFALGGHSLLGVKFLMLLEERHGIRLQLQAVFAYPTIKALAAKAETAEGQARQAIPVVPNCFSICPVFGSKTHVDPQYLDPTK